jgi:hypothetical protein
MGGAASSVSSSVDLKTVQEFNKSARFKFEGADGLEQKFMIFSKGGNKITASQFHEYVDYLKIMQPGVSERIKLDEEAENDRIKQQHHAIQVANNARYAAFSAALAAAKRIDGMLLAVLPTVWKHRLDSMQNQHATIATAVRGASDKLQAWAASGEATIDIGDWACLEWEKSGAAGVEELEAKTHAIVAAARDRLAEIMDAQTATLGQKQASG